MQVRNLLGSARFAACMLSTMADEDIVIDKEGKYDGWSREGTSVDKEGHYSGSTHEGVAVDKDGKYRGSEGGN